MGEFVAQGSLIGDYRVEAFLGRGGMGAVYRAVHEKIGRVVAIKVLDPERQGHGFVERFYNEARIHCRLQHPNIATLYEFVEARGRLCIVMEYVDGRTLDEIIREFGRLSAGDALFLFEQMIEAVGYVHRHNIIHRDLKPNNIKVDTSDHVKVLDFGIAKSDISPTLTRTDQVVGTINYLSPEQFTREKLDERSDIWALGTILYEMVTGVMAFDAATLAEMYSKITKAEYVLPSRINPEVPRSVEQVIVRCLRKNPAQRYQSAQALLEHVKQISNGPSPRPAPAPRPVARRRLKLAAAALAALALVVVVGKYLPWPGSGAGNGSASSQTPAVLAPPTGTGKVWMHLHVYAGEADVIENGVLKKIRPNAPYSFLGTEGEKFRVRVERDGRYQIVEGIVSAADQNKQVPEDNWREMRQP